MFGKVPNNAFGDQRLFWWAYNAFGNQRLYGVKKILDGENIPY